MIDAIKKRISVRTYSEKHVEASKIAELSAYAAENSVGPFGNTVRFMVVDASDYNPAELRKLGTYGMIRGARLYLTGAVRIAAGANEDFGYCMERVVLKATELGLGTCWLAGSLNRDVFGKLMNLKQDEAIPAITPVGYAADSKSMIERAARWARPCITTEKARGPVF